MHTAKVEMHIAYTERARLCWMSCCPLQTSPCSFCKLQVLDPERRVVFLDTTGVRACTDHEEDGTVSNPGELEPASHSIAHSLPDLQRFSIVLFHSIAPIP